MACALLLRVCIVCFYLLRGERILVLVLCMMARRGHLGGFLAIFMEFCAGLGEDGACGKRLIYPPQYGLTTLYDVPSTRMNFEFTSPFLITVPLFDK